MNTNGALATNLVFLNDLPSLPRGSKVRFLGCVTKYVTRTGFLILHHSYPSSPHASPVAVVDVNLLLSSLKTTDTQRGEWVNVMGYVEAKTTGSRHGKGGRNDMCTELVGVKVQAIMLWSAGSLKLGEYEQALASMKNVEQDIECEEVSASSK